MFSSVHIYLIAINYIIITIIIDYCYYYHSHTSGFQTLIIHAKVMQWNLFIKESLGPANLYAVEMIEVVHTSEVKMY